jgi:glucoamylase
MPRSLTFSNGRLLVNFDHDYYLRDLYWPHVGSENHTMGHLSRFGFYCDGRFSWMADPQWEKRLDYAHDTLMSEVELRHRGYGIAMTCHDIVDFHEDLFLRRIEVVDEGTASESGATSRKVRLFFCHDFHILENDVGDTAYYEPERRSVLHYKLGRWFMINTAKKSHDQWVYGVDQWAVGEKETGGREGTWRDAEDGELSGNAVVQGSVDSVVALDLEVPAGGRAVGWYWIAVATDFQEVTHINRTVREKGPDTFLDRTQHYWRLWVHKARSEEAELPEVFTNLYRRSLLIVRGHIDDEGGILAATDFDTTAFGHDTYAYVWPRDGALAAHALVRAGYSQAVDRFFEFCHRVITPEGYLLHKYNPDGSLASTWHGWYYDGKKTLPIQEDETALVIWALRAHFDQFHNVEFIKPLYRGLVIRAANWMAGYVNEQGLPLPSWDLWEERHGIHAWTIGAVWAGLRAAARFAADFGEGDLATRYNETADRMRAAAIEILWDEETRHFVRTLSVDTSMGSSKDKTLDMSLSGLWYFGMLDAADGRIAATMEALKRRLRVQSSVGGMARYENDYYYRMSPDVNRIPGNPWFVCTLWLAQWHIRKATTVADLEPATDLMKWAASRALSNGLMSEQINPFTDEPLSACPLTWSHAIFVHTVQEYVAKCCQLHIGCQQLHDVEDVLEPVAAGG